MFKISLHADGLDNHIRSNSFGGGSEMMRDSDKDHFWHVLESGLKCVYDTYSYDLKI